MTIQGALPQKPLLCMTVQSTVILGYGRAIDYSGGLGLAAARPLGILQSSVAIGDYATVVLEGIAEVELASSCTPGDPLTANATGTLQVAATGQYVLARALGTGNAGGRVLALIVREGNLN